MEISEVILESEDPRFLHRVGQARKSLRAGRGIRVEDLESIMSDVEVECRSAWATAAINWYLDEMLRMIEPWK